MAMFPERIVMNVAAPVPAVTAEEALRTTMRRLVKGLNGLYGKVLTDLITEGQSDPAIVRDLYEEHIKIRQAADVAEIERAKATGEFAADAKPELLVDAIFGSLFYRHLLHLPLTEQYGDELIDAALRGVLPRA